MITDDGAENASGPPPGAALFGPYCVPSAAAVRLRRPTQDSRRTSTADAGCFWTWAICKAKRPGETAPAVGRGSKLARTCNQSYLSVLTEANIGLL